MGGLNKTPWRVVGDELLADGNWHPREDVIRAMMALVPPSMAQRARDRQRSRARAVPRKTDRRQTIRERTELEKLLVGQRQVVNETLTEAVRHGTWERDGDMIRKRP